MGKFSTFPIPILVNFYLIERMSVQRFKVVILGEGRVGKTSILLRYTKGEYNDRQVSTLQASYLDKRLTLGGTTAHLSIWDTAGQERFHALSPIYYRDADGALLVYDITDAESFSRVKKWVKELRKIVGSDINITIAGNKCDMEKNRSVQESEATAYAESVGAAHFNTSAKTNKGLDETFNDLSNNMLTRRNKEGGSGGGGSSGGGRGGGSRGKQKLVIVDDTPRESTTAKSGCC
jgi:Ras-related protein Rab-21